MPHTTATASTQPHNHQRWTRLQTLLLLELLLEAKRDEHLNSSKSAVLKPVIKGFIPDLEKEFPNRQWDYEMLDNKFRRLRDYWRVFRDAEKPSGAVYNPDTGKIEMSKANEDAIVAKHGKLRCQVIDNGLIIDKVIIFNS